ncbi:MAG: hypothetical protein R2834_10685 [Rhodothermales bacterium]
MALPCRYASLLLLFVAVLAVGCDTGFAGDAFDNEPPETAMSVRDTSLVDNILDSERLSSTVLVSWSGDDPDGFVASYEVRFYPLSEPPATPDAGWVRTTRTDSLILLPIPPGNKIANVAFEVRAIDNESLADPTPARTVFPIENAPPSIRLLTFDLPPDTTFQVFSLGWDVSDPEGIENISRIEVSLNDSTNFVGVPAEFDFITLIGDVDIEDDTQTTTDARIYLGRGFQSSELRLPNLLLDATNTIYVRAVDLTDTTSTLERYTWHVKKQRSDILYVNDWRKSNAPILQRFHMDLLRSHLPEGAPIDVWDITVPFVTGAAGNVPRSELLPNNAVPTLQQTLALYKHIYWVATNTTNSTQRNNFPFAVAVLDEFFDNGGTIIVHSPVTLPPDPEDNLGNPAILLLPMNNLITFPDTLRQQLRLRPGTSVTPVNTPAGASEPLPALTFTSFDINSLPYIVAGTNAIPLYEAGFTYVSTSNTQGAWTGPSTIASISADRRIALFAIPLINEQTGAPILVGADGAEDGGRRAISLMLESLGFPKR